MPEKPEKIKAERERLKAELIALDEQHQGTAVQNTIERDKLKKQIDAIGNRLTEIDAEMEAGQKFMDRVHWQPIMLLGSQVLMRFGISVSAKATIATLLGFGAAPAAVVVGEAMAVANVARQTRKEEARLKDEGVEVGLHRRALYGVTTRDREESKDLKGWRKGVDTLGWMLDLPTNQMMQLAANVSRDRKQALKYINEINQATNPEEWFKNASEKDVRKMARYFTRLRMMGYGAIDLKNRQSREEDAQKITEWHEKIDGMVNAQLATAQVEDKRKLDVWQANGSLNEEKLLYDAKGQYLKMAVAVAAGKLATVGAGSMMGMFLGGVAHNMADGQSLFQASGSATHEAGQHLQQVIKGVAPPVERPPVDWANLSRHDSPVFGPQPHDQLTAAGQIKNGLAGMDQTGAHAKEVIKNGAASLGVQKGGLVQNPGFRADDIPSTRNMISAAKEVVRKVKDLLPTLGYSHGVEHSLQVTGGQSPEQIANQFNTTLHTTQSGIFTDGISYSSEAANSLDIAIASGREAFTKPELYDLFVKQFADTFHVQPGFQMVGYQDIIDHPELRATFDQLVFAAGKEAVIPKIVHRLAAPGTYAALHNLKPR